MATEEQLNVVIKTVADTAGAQQVSQALQQTQRAGAGAQQQLTSSQQGANAVMRALLQQHGATLENFQKARETVSQSTGITPTLLPRDFGIQAAEAAVRAKAVGEATRTVGESAHVTGNEVARMGAAFVGAGIGLSAFTAAGQLAHQVVTSFVTDTIGLDQATRNNTIALGQQAPGFQAWAQQVSQAAGVTQQSLLQASTAAEQFRRQVGLGPEATTQLTALATVLGQIRGSDPSQTMTQLSQAMQGNAGAANALGLQLDAATLSYQNFGDATGEVFAMLDPSSQAALRYEAALGQLHNQLQASTGPVQELQKAQGALSASWEAFTTTTGPGVVGLLAQITGGANAALEAWNKLVAIQLQQEKTQPTEKLPSLLGRGRDFVGEQVQGVTDRLAQQTDKLRGELGQSASDLGTSAKAVNDALRDTTGFDAQATAANALGTAVNATGQVFDALGTAASGAANAISEPFRVADQDMRNAAATAGNLRETQLKALAAQVAAPSAALAGARQNEAAASEELVRLRRESVDLASDEARIRLGMLPATERMLELTNATTQAQIRAQQATLGPSRAQQDLQDQIRLNTLIAQSPDRSLAERQQALATATALTRRTPETDIAALQAQLGARPAQQTAQDVGLAAQLQNLQQQQALFPAEYQRQQDALLSTVADAAKQAAQRDIAFDIQAINVTINQTGAITPEDERRIGTFASDQVTAAIHSAVQSVNKRGAAPQLMAATGPS